MSFLTPTSGEELSQLLAEGARSGRTMTLEGNGSKRLMGGPVVKAELAISTQGLTRVLDYEPNDLTISVQAGLRFAELQDKLQRRGQMIALDPPFLDEATVGGVIAANTSGPMRRGFGTARDLVIGMQFATLEGKLVRSGGMVVKNVAGLDMGKLMIGSFGTLAAIVSVNFRVHPLPEGTRTFLLTSTDLESAVAKRSEVLQSPLQPIALDLLSPAAAARVGQRGFLLAIRAGGSKTVLERYSRELNSGEQMSGHTEDEFWKQVSQFAPDFLRRMPGGIVLRISTSLEGVVDVLRMTTGSAVCRAGSGVTYVFLSSWQATAPYWRAALERKWTVVVEYAPDEIRSSKELWPAPSSTERQNGFAMMKQVKQMFDPGNLLNRSRMYGRF